MNLKINKLEPVLLDCYHNDKLIGTVSNSYECLDIRLQIAERQITGCYLKVSPLNKNFELINEDEKDLIINISQCGMVDKWFSEVYINNKPITVYSETLSKAIELRSLQLDFENT